MDILRRGDHAAEFELYLDTQPAGYIRLLYESIKHGRPECLRVLLARDVHTQLTQSCQSSLIYAAKHSMECLTVLLQHDVNKHSRDYCGNTPIMMVAEAGVPNIEAVRMLIDHGANVNDYNNDGVTVLMCAAMSGYDEIVELLLSHGADPTIVDGDGFTALGHAKQGLDDLELADYDDLSAGFRHCIDLLSGGGSGTKSARHSRE